MRGTGVSSLRAPSRADRDLLIIDVFYGYRFAFAEPRVATQPRKLGSRKLEGSELHGSIRRPGAHDARRRVPVHARHRGGVAR